MKAVATSLSYNEFREFCLHFLMNIYKSLLNNCWCYRNTDAIYSNIHDILLIIGNILQQFEVDNILKLFTDYNKVLTLMSTLFKLLLRFPLLCSLSYVRSNLITYSQDMKYSKCRKQYSLTTAFHLF